MTCSIQKREQTASRDGANPSRLQQWKLRQHCRICETCQAEQARIKQIETGLQTLASAQTPSHVHAALMAQLPELRSADLPLTVHEDIVLDRNGNVRQRQLRRRWAVVISASAVIAVGGAQAIPRLQEALFTFMMRPKIITRTRETHSWGYNALNRHSEDNTKFLAEAQHLRYLWKPWAMRHKQELRQMLDADAENQTALRWIACTLPILPRDKEAGITLQDLGGESGDYDWLPSLKSADGMADHWKEDFAQFHDLALARSTNGKFHRYTLWASGRITEETTVAQPNLNGSGLTDVPQTREVGTPYEEITTKP